MRIIAQTEIAEAHLVSSNVSEDDYPAYAAGTTYALGARMIEPIAHTVWESKQGGNLGHDPTLTSSADWWLKVGQTNRWRMFDASVTSQTEKLDSLTVVLAPTGRVNALALINISAASAHITMTDAVEGVVYERTISLIDHAGIDDFYSWFFAPVELIGDLALFDLPPYLNATITITLSHPGNTVRCGWLVAGMAKTLGDTMWGMQLSIDDYSVKSTDAWGNVEVVERNYSRDGNFVLRVARGKVDALAKFLPTLRAKTVVWVGSGEYASTILVGFFESFKIEIQGYATHICSLNVKGVT